MNKRQSSSILILGLMLLFLISGCRQTVTETTSQGTSKKDTTTFVKTTTPTLFLHGYSGTKNSFGGMLKRLEKADSTKKELTITVSPDGTIQANGKLSGKATNPSIQVLFSDNKNNEWNQTEWIKAVLVYLKETYQITEVNLVGHSMGGISGLRFLGTYGTAEELPRIVKFISIGAPFNDFIDTSATQTIDEVIATGPTEVNDRYEEYQQFATTIPTTIPFLLIGGQLSEDELSDGTVPLTSALAVTSLLRNHGNSVTTKIIHGDQAQHSRLHENTEVDQLVTQFLWGK